MKRLFVLLLFTCAFDAFAAKSGCVFQTKPQGYSGHKGNEYLYFNDDRVKRLECDSKWCSDGYAVKINDYSTTKTRVKGNGPVFVCKLEGGGDYWYTASHENVSKCSSCPEDGVGGWFGKRAGEGELVYMLPTYASDSESKWYTDVCWCPETSPAGSDDSETPEDESDDAYDSDDSETSSDDDSGQQSGKSLSDLIVKIKKQMNDLSSKCNIPIPAAK